MQTADGSSVRAEKIMLAVFWPIQAACVVGEQDCDLDIPSCAKKTALGKII